MIEPFPLEDYHAIRLPEPIRIGIVSHFIRTGVGNAISIDGLLQLETGHLKFLPFEPALTTTAVVVWKKYRLLSKSSEAFLRELKKRVPAK